MRLIDADELKDMMIQAYNDALPDFSVPWQRELAHNVTISLMADIDETPTVDAVPVVRCKDCKYYLHSNEKCELIDTRLHFYETRNRWTDDDFCAWGKRKGGDE